MSYSLFDQYLSELIYDEGRVNRGAPPGMTYIDPTDKAWALEQFV